MVGFWYQRNRRHHPYASAWLRRTAPKPFASVSRKYSLRSIPADHASPSPDSTRTPTSSRNSSSSSTSIIRRLSVGLMQLRFAGRLNLTHAILFSTSNETLSSAMAILLMRAAESEAAVQTGFRAPDQALNSNREVSRSGLHRDPSQFRELGDAGLASETAMPGRAHSAERHLRFDMHGGTV